MLGTLDKNQILRKVDLFRGLSFENLTTISRIAEPESFKPGSVIFCQKTPGDFLYVVVEGSVKIVLETEKGSIPVTQVPRYGIFEKMAILDKQPQPTTAISDSAVVLLRIGKNDFHDLLRQHPDLGLWLLCSMSDRIRHLQKDRHAGD